MVALFNLIKIRSPNILLIFYRLFTTCRLGDTKSSFRGCIKGQQECIVNWPIFHKTNVLFNNLKKKMQSTKYRHPRIDKACLMGGNMAISLKLGWKSLQFRLLWWALMIIHHIEYWCKNCLNLHIPLTIYLLGINCCNYELS